MPQSLSADAARRERWASHLLGGSELDPAAVVDRAVALQGQDLPAVLRAIAIRSRPGTTIADVRAAFDAGLLVRSWPMRGTLFATTPAHLATLLAHTGERTIRSMALRRKQLGLDEAIIDRAREVLLAALPDGGMTRAAVLQAWDGIDVPTGSGRGYHLLVQFALEGLVHWGPFDEGGAEQLLVRSGPPDAAAGGRLPEVLGRAIAARGPMTEADLAWWTKLPKGLLRPALETVDGLVEVSLDGTPALQLGEPDPDAPAPGVALVPGFDEWVLGYENRSLVASPAAFAALVPGNNGVFRPAVLVDGRVMGSWRVPVRQGRSGEPIVDLVEPVTAAQRRAIDAAVAAWPHS